MRAMVIGETTWDAAKGVWRCVLDSPYQRCANLVEVLLPEDHDATSARPIVYVLPVEAGVGGKFGDGLQEVRRLGLHNRHGVVCVSPAFDTIPWYGAHASDPTIRHERYLIDVLVPFIESRYRPAEGLGRRLLLGFSKSGWGALTLLLRNPDFFGCACSWDAPLMMDAEHFGYYGTGTHFGTRENFAGYLPRRVFSAHAHQFHDRGRLAVLGSSEFGGEPLGLFRDRPHTRFAHETMSELGIAHVFDDDLRFPHAWNGGWLGPAMAHLLAMARA